MKQQQAILLYKFSPTKLKIGLLLKLEGYKAKIIAYKLELLSLETMKLLGITKEDVDQDKDVENVPKLEPVDIVLLHCSLVNNNYQ